MKFRVYVREDGKLEQLESFVFSSQEEAIGVMNEAGFKPTDYVIVIEK